MKRRVAGGDDLSLLAWILFFIWPFGILLVAINNFSNKRYRIFIWMYMVFYGLMFVIKELGSDAYAHHENFQEVALKPFSELYNILHQFITMSGDDLDIYAPLVNFLVSRFSTDTAHLFAVHAAVYGFFYLKSITLIYDEFNGKINSNAWLFFIMFIGLFSIHQINAVRYYTALWVWVYGALLLLTTRKWPYIFICLSASLVHFGVTLATGVIFVFFLLGRRDYLYIPLLISSFILGQFYQLSVFVEFGSKVSDAAEQRAVGYTSDSYIEMRQEGLSETAWFIRWRSDSLHYFVLGALLFIYLRRKRFYWDVQQKYLLSFLMFFLSFVNFVLKVPSLGGRMRFIFWTMAAYFFYRFYQLNDIKKINLVKWAGFFPIMLWIAVEFRISAYFTHILVILGNPIFRFFDKSYTTLFDIFFKEANTF